PWPRRAKQACDKPDHCLRRVRFGVISAQSIGSRCGWNVRFAPKATVCNQAANLSLSANSGNGAIAPPCGFLSDPSWSLRGAAERSRMTRQFNLFAGIRDLGSVYLQNRDIAVEKVSNIRVSAVRRKDHTLGKTADFNFACFCNLLTIDLKRHRRTVLAGEKCLLIGVPRYENGESQVALWADGEALRGVANDDVIDDSRGAGIEINHTHRVDIAVGSASSSVVCNQCDVAAWHDIDVVWKDTSWHIILLVKDLSAIDPEERHFVHNWLDGERLGAIGRDRNMSDAVAHCDCVGEFYIFAGDSQNANRIVRPV